MSDLLLNLPDISGADRGIHSSGDLVTQTSDGVDLNVLWNEYQATLNQFNAGRTALVNFLTFPVTQLTEFIPTAGGDDFEEASEFGVAKSIQGEVGGTFHGYDFKWYDLAARFTWKFLADAPRNRVDAVHAAALEADNRLVFRKIMGSIFSNVGRTNAEGNPVHVFYNGDGNVPPTVKGKDFTGAHSHYLVSGATTIDSGDLEQLIDTIAEHGFGPTDGSTIVMLMNKQEVDAVRRFRANETNSNGAIALYDFIPGNGQPTLILPSAEGLLGSTPPSSINGMPVVGAYGNALIVEEAYIPAGYVLAFATGGAANLRNPLGIREHANASMRGLRLINGERAGYPIINSYYQRGLGTGVRQRGSGAILQVKATGSYTPPAQFPVI